MVRAAGAKKASEALKGTDDEQDTEAKAAAPPASTSNGVHGAPSFALERIGEELPAEEPRSRVVTRTDLLNNLESIQSEPGVWFKVAEYATPNGASKTLKALEEGKITAPEGAGEYDVETRRGPKRDNGKRGSVLYAMYVVEGAGTGEGSSEG